jgi:hypothetical protein
LEKVQVSFFFFFHPKNYRHMASIYTYSHMSIKHRETSKVSLPYKEIRKVKVREVKEEEKILSKWIDYRDVKAPGF